MLPKHYSCELHSSLGILFYFLNHLSNWFDASQTSKEHGPAVCQVITTSLPSSLQDTIIGCQRYQLEPAQLFPTLCETFAAIVGACSLSLSAWQVRIILCPCHLQRERGEGDRQYSLSSAISDSGKSASIFCYLAFPSGEICNAVQKYYVNRLPRLILTGRKIKQWMDFSFRCFILDKRWWKRVRFLNKIQFDLQSGLWI